MTGLAHIRVGHTHHHKRAASCPAGGFYLHPANGATVDASQPLNIAWNPSCLNTSAVDIYLYAPGASQSRIHMWETVNNALGSYNATIQPSWWNNTSPMMLQLSVVKGGTLAFQSPYPAGPVFTATTHTPTSSSAAHPSAGATTGSAITYVNNLPVPKKPLSPGRKAAAALFPLLIVAALLAYYIRRTRIKSKEQSKRFSQAVDKRMSTISTDWKSMSGAAANAAIRNSIAVSGNRASSFSFGPIRPHSTFTVDGGQAGIGSRSTFSQDNSSSDSQPPSMSQLRPGLRTSAFGERVSRVSFAADTRPSTDRRTVTSRAFHSAISLPSVPDLPTRQNSDDSQSSPGSMSPTQTKGPLTLTPEDIRARIAGQPHTANPSVDEVMPALSLMRTGSNDGDDFLLSSPVTSLPQPPSPSYMKSPVGMMPMQPMPANVMSPDEMLRAYAERRGTGTGTGASGVSFPAPVANYNGNGMRTLYSPSTPTTPVATIPAGPGARRATLTANHGLTRPETYVSEYSQVEEADDESQVGMAE